jgi:hypothetical protein
MNYHLEKIVADYRNHAFTILDFLYEAELHDDKMYFMIITNEKQTDVIGICYCHKDTNYNSNNNYNRNSNNNYNHNSNNNYNRNRNNDYFQNILQTMRISPVILNYKYKGLGFSLKITNFFIEAMSKQFGKCRFEFDECKYKTKSESKHNSNSKSNHESKSKTKFNYESKPKSNHVSKPFYKTIQSVLL